MDARLFDAYNRCDLKTLGAMVAEDLEFYHDQTSLSVGKEPFIAAMRQEIGVHCFNHPAQPEQGAGEARFITLWQNKDGDWKVTRAISYNHEPLPK